MALSYLTGGAELSAANMNLLWAELDRKLNLILTGKTPLVLLSKHPAKYASIANALGKKFFFLGTGPKHFTPAMPDAVAYDHTTFTAAIATGTVTETDDATGLALMTFGSSIDLDNSLEAHRVNVGGVDYWIRVATHPRATRRSRYGVAELIFEGQTSYAIPANYNRYNFLRIHNLNRATLTITFEGDNEITYEIPPLGCQAIRRDFSSGTFAYPLTYLWETETGDPRCYQLSGDHAGNNVVSPAVAFVWISAFIANKRNEFGWRIDPTISHDLSGYDALFADPDIATTKLVDLMRHHGKLMVVRRLGAGAIDTTTLDYDKDTNLSSIFAPFGITRSGNTLEPPAGTDIDLVALGTNLFKSGEDTKCFVELPASIEETLTGLGNFTTTPIVTEPTETEQYFNTSGVIVDVSQKVDLLAYQFETIPDLALPASDVSDFTGSLTGYNGATAHLSINGWYWEANLELPIGTPGLADLIDDIEDADDEAGKLWYDAHSEALKYTRRHSLGRHGWPENIFGGGPPRRWYSPRLPARFQDLGLDLNVNWNDDAIDGWAGPDIATAPNGGDIEIIPTDSQRLGQYGLLGLVPYATDTIQDRVWPEHYFCADPFGVHEFLTHYSEAGWYEANRARLINGPITETANGIVGPAGEKIALLWPMLTEHYNHIAWRINSLTRGHPIQLWDIYFYVTYSSDGLLDGGLQSTFRPWNQFRRVALGDDYYNQALELGITVKNYNTLPTSYQNIRSQSHYSTNWFYRLTEEVLSGSVSFFGGSWYGTVDKEATYAGIIYGSGQSAYDTGYFDHAFYQPGDLNDEYFWISIEDVKTVSDSLGLTFSFGLGNVDCWQLRTSSTAPVPTFLFESNSTNQTQSSAYGTEAAAQAWVDGLVGSTSTSEHQFQGNRQYVRMMPAQVLGEVEWISDSEGDLPDYRNQSVDQMVKQLSNKSNLCYFDINKPLEVRQVDEGEYRTRAYLVWGGIECGTYAFRVPKHYWIRTPGYSAISIANAAHAATYGNLARPVSIVEPLSANQEVDTITASAVFRARNAPSNYELAIFDDRFINLT